MHARPRLLHSGSGTPQSLAHIHVVIGEYRPDSSSRTKLPATRAHDTERGGATALPKHELDNSDQHQHHNHCTDDGSDKNLRKGDYRAILLPSPLAADHEQPPEDRRGNLKQACLFPGDRVFFGVGRVSTQIKMLSQN